MANLGGGIQMSDFRTMLALPFLILSMMFELAATIIAGRTIE